ncbi:winged helix-turn-helix transcriptional regulator [Cystobacter fuscus]|uniref:winged helix-turn-helix transcriptional regulator n=1 Tax=Cystobacter fuscus TaxID=43 RepID=UPI002B27FEC9|nr:helix-turn-helix transcriptional regulator [Cystobacter fuscus]
MVERKKPGTLATKLAQARKKREQGDVLEPMCPSRSVLEHVTSRWGVMVLVSLLEDTHRFSELRRKVGGVSEKMLAQTLHALEEDGFVLRQAYAEIPPRVDYSLTPMGRQVAERLEALVDWIEENMSYVLEARDQHPTRKRAS